MIRYVVDGIWQHDPLYPTECDTNGNINNVIVITEADPPPAAVESQEGESQTLEISKTADEAPENVKKDDVVSIQEHSDNISDSSKTVNNEGDLATEGKAEVETDTASINCKTQGNAKAKYK